jgi:hypothetical protein
MPVVAKRLGVGIALALTLLGPATSAALAARRALYRTDRQADRYLVWGLKSWRHVDLRDAASRSGFCVSSAEQRSGKRSPNARFRSFFCVLDVTGEHGRTHVFGLHLVSIRRGWRVASLR